MPLTYPFSAVVGCEYDPTTSSSLDEMGLALVLAAVSPEIGGVLIRGEKGTAKSTTVRGLAEVLPPIRVHEGDRFSVDPDDVTSTSPDAAFGTSPIVARPVRLVELPVGASEDRVLGSLNLERALTSGAVEFEPGLLARAHRGVLYVDEVNLLHDHLVDLLLDAAATGQVTVERDGVSVGHRARFVLIGTMNPEEGELRPQLLDRFGLTVSVAAPRDPSRRVEVVRRRLAFDADPATFVGSYASRQADLSARIGAARERLEAVELTDAALMTIAEVCAAFDVDGLRADIVTARTALAHAAWQGRAHVTKADIRVAALLALPHRRRRNPFDAPGLDEDLLDQVLGDDDLPDPPNGAAPNDPDDAGPHGAGEPDNPGDAPAAGPDMSGAPGSGPDSGLNSELDGAPEGGPRRDAAEAHDADPEPATGAPSPAGGTSVHVAEQTYQPRVFTIDGVGLGVPGRRSKGLGETGRRVAARPGRASLHVVETLRAAAERHAGRARAGEQFTIQASDLRTAVREGKEANLLVFCVDASGSMAARRRMVQVKTAILSLLTDAYRRRDKVALISFRGDGADLTLPPTRSIDVAAALLDDLPAGGRTPLAEALVTAGSLVRRERLRDPRLRPLLVVVTDGRATAGSHAVPRSRSAAEHVASLAVPSVVIDCEDGPIRMGLALRLAAHLRAEHVPMAHVSASGLVDVVTRRVA